MVKVGGGWVGLGEDGGTKVWAALLRKDGLVRNRVGDVTR